MSNTHARLQYLDQDDQTEEATALLNSRSDYDFDNPPMRTNLRRRILDITRANSENARKRHGISGKLVWQAPGGKSAFFRLPTVHFNHNWPYDSLHWALSNVVP